MAEYTSSNITVMKTDKKDILLTSKDPHLSHIFEHPNLPRNATPDGLRQSTLDVEGVFPGAEDYPLFEEQGGSYMPDLSPDSSHLMLDNQRSFQNNISTPRLSLNKSKNSNNEGKSHMTEQADMLIQQSRSSEVKPFQQQNTNAKTTNKPPKMLEQTSRNINQNWNGMIPGAISRDKFAGGRYIVPPHLLPIASSQAPPVPLTSPPADHYNMQLLAHSAQQHQQLLQQQQHFGSQASSSGALQQLALRAQLGQQDNSAALQKLISGLHYPDNKMKSFVSLPRLQGHGWAITDRATPEFVRLQQKFTSDGQKFASDGQKFASDGQKFASDGQKFASDGQKFASDGQKFPSDGLNPAAFLPADDSRSTPTLFLPPRIPPPPPTTVVSGPEPELKSPLDHPEQRFFSGEHPSATSERANEEEARLNERDKAAAAALGKLLEQNEKKPPRETPPPSYDAPQADQSLFGYEPRFHGAPTVPNGVKQEPRSPAVTFAQHFLKPPFSEPAGLEGENFDARFGNSRLLKSDNFEARFGNSRMMGTLASIQPSVQIEPHISIPTSTKVTTPARVRKTSSSSNSGRKNSDGSLTCNLCGHTFRSTPALNGHMRVHSSSDKKQNKDERRSFPEKPPFVQFPNSLPPNYPGLDPLNQPHILQNRNGLLDIASAATMLKSEPSKVEFPYSQPYLTPMLANEPPKLEVDPQNYPHFYAPTNLPFSNLNFAPNHHEFNPQFMTSQVVDTQAYTVERPPETSEDFQTFSYERGRDSNPLSQLASIAVATGNRDNSADYFGNPEMRRTVTTDAWMGDPATFEPETSPIRTGNDPFILPVTAPVQGHFQSRFGGYEGHPVVENEVRVTWKDNESFQGQGDPLMSYDDPLMRDAVNVANPSKILPNSMMGGTPTGFGGSRSFRQRHHSEGSHLVKPTSILKQILHSPVPTVKLRAGTGENVEPGEIQRPIAPFGAKPEPSEELKAPEPQNQAPSTGNREIWAEPRPIQRRIRRRRHSADCRLLKSGSLTNGKRESRFLPGGSPVKRAGKTRHRPPPLVIPLNVNAFSSANSLYFSHLHKHRRPSGDSGSSYNGADKIPPYTPPPMLSPIRAGSGLYCTTPVTSMKFGIPPIPEVDESLIEDELARSTDPKINIGSRFQATIPDLCPKIFARKEKHNAELIWRISEKSAENEKIIDHLERFMELSCSAVVPYGGSNKEYALQSLHSCSGDILTAVKNIISKKVDTPRAGDVTAVCTGSGRPWTPQESKTFDRGMLENRKDFYVIASQVKSRSTFECVERYYHVVKRHRRRAQRPRRYRGDGTEKDILSRLAGAEREEGRDSSEEEKEKIEKSIYAGSGPASWPMEPNSEVKSPQLKTPQYSMQSKLQPQTETQKKTQKSHSTRVKQVLSSLSPAGSPASVASLDEQPPQIFTCPVCGKSFAKVKSRNAHMKTHGKQAQEKRRLREEEAARKRDEKNRPRAEFRPPQTFVHPHHPVPHILSHYGGNP